MTYEGGFGQAPGNEAQGNLNHTYLFLLLPFKKIFFCASIFFSCPGPGRILYGGSVMCIGSSKPCGWETCHRLLDALSRTCAVTDTSRA